MMESSDANVMDQSIFSAEMSTPVLETATMMFWQSPTANSLTPTLKNVIAKMVSVGMALLIAVLENVHTMTMSTQQTNLIHKILISASVINFTNGILTRYDVKETAQSQKKL